jgi:hypothetical protein
MEIWKRMEEFGDNYSVSNLGRVRSEDRTITKSNGFKYTFLKREIVLSDNGTGYLMIKAKVMGVTKRAYVHRMVYKYFIGELNSDMQINHIDFNKSNNSVSNLEQVTCRQNLHHSRINRPKTSEYPCVYYFCNKYVGRFYVKSKGVYCGRYEMAIEAAIAVKTKMAEYNLEYGGHV